MEKLRNNPHFAVIVFVAIFVASVYMLLADKAMAR